MTKRLILIADDYAIAPGVSAAICRLAELGRLTGTGVMAGMSHWPAAAPALRALAGRVEAGLHITLTDQAPLGPMPRLAPQGRLPPIARLIGLALSGRLPQEEIAAEIARQFERFIAHYGAAPDFIDGHQHAHILPGIWPLVKKLADGASKRIWLRDCGDWTFWRRPQGVKAGIVTLLGCHVARRAPGLITNHGFSGFYDYASSDLRQSFQPMLAGASDWHLMMVHPGIVDPALIAVDSLTQPREAEYGFLASEEFTEKLASSGFAVAQPGTLAAQI